MISNLALMILSTSRQQSIRLPGRPTGTALWTLATMMTAAALFGCGAPAESERPLPGHGEGAASTPQTPQPPPTPGTSPSPSAEYDPRSVIVRFKPVKDRSSLRARQADALSKVRATFLDRNNDGVYDRFAHVEPSGQLMALDLDPSVSVPDALAALRQLPSVQYAEPNYIYRSLTAPGEATAGPAAPPRAARRTVTAALPGDERFPELHGLHNTGFTGGTPDADIDAPEAWDISTGSSSIVVGVIDIGVDYTHEDLVANMWVNPGEIAGNGLDDDGNGVIDDVHGFNSATGSGDPMDLGFHGTLCAGILGAVGNNGIGVAGVNWNVSIMAIKYISDDGGGGSAVDAIAAINYAVGRRNAGVNLRVLSNSWGGHNYSLALQDAIEAANAADILFVAASGNSNNDNDNDSGRPMYPASYPQDNIISVAATDQHDVRLSYSNYGATTVDLAAPGVDILSTVPGDGYASLNGTTVSTPFVAGAAALLLSTNQSLTNAQVKQLLLSTGDELPSLAGITVSGRRLNVANALLAAGPPVPDFDVSAGPSRGFVNQEGTARFEAQIASRGGFSDEVQLSVTSNPPINAVITAAPVTAPGSSTISLATSTATAPGPYAFTITAQSGGVTRSRRVSLFVRPLGSLEHELHSADTPIPIPDDDLEGVRSVVRMSQAVDISDLELELELLHPNIADLNVTLISPSGTRVVLHQRGVGDIIPNLRRTYSLPAEFTGEQAFGDWTLHVDDILPFDSGVLNRWTLRIFGPPSAPTFLLAVDPRDVQVVQNSSAQVGLDVTPLVGFDETVSLSATSSPPLAGQLSFSPATLPGGGASALTVAPSCDAAPGVYQVTVRAAGGDVVREQRLTVEVFSFGSSTLSVASTDTPLPIPDAPLPDADTQGTAISSRITITESFPIEDLHVEVLAFHEYIGDLVLELIGPNGEVVMLRDRADDNRTILDETYAVTAFDGQLSAGQWTLRVQDALPFYTGSLESWKLHLRGPRTPGRACGDPPVLSIERILRNRATFEFVVDLSWTNAQGALVELHRNGQLVDLPNNDGAHRDQFRRYDTAFTWKLCEQRSPLCSNEVSVVFGTSSLGADGAPTEATLVIKGDDGSWTSRVVKIEDL